MVVVQCWPLTLILTTPGYTFVDNYVYRGGGTLWCPPQTSTELSGKEVVDIEEMVTETKQNQQ